MSFPKDTLGLGCTYLCKLCCRLLTAVWHAADARPEVEHSGALAAPGRVQLMHRLRPSPEYIRLTHPLRPAPCMLDNAVPQYAYPQAYGTDPISTQMLMLLQLLARRDATKPFACYSSKLVLHSHKALSHISKGCRRSSASGYTFKRVVSAVCSPAALQTGRQGCELRLVCCCARRSWPRRTLHAQTESWQMEGGVRLSSYKRARQALVQEEPASMEEEDECARVTCRASTRTPWWFWHSCTVCTFQL